MSAAQTAFDILLNLLTGDISEATKKDLFKRTPENALKQDLAAYLVEQRREYPQEWTEIKEAVRQCVILGNPYGDAVNTGVNREKTLAHWMAKYHGGHPETVQTVYEGCFDIIETHIRKWDDFTPDMLMHLARSSQKIIRLLTEVIAKQSRSDSARNVTVKDSTKSYRKRWTDNIFLNDPGDIDDDISPVRLCDIHVPYHYSTLNLRSQKETRSKDENALRERLSQPGGHLVLGDPGIGKSSLICWYLNTSDCELEKALAYELSQFSLTGEKSNPGDTLLEQMGKEQEELKGCILFLDGLDECSLTPDQRAEYINRLNMDWGNDFSWVITCRLNYIGRNDLSKLRIPRITLLPLEPSQIGDYLTVFEQASKQTIPLDKRAALVSHKHRGRFGSPFGIPLVLYMTAAMDNITVTEDSTLVTVYDQLFDELFRRRYDTHDHGLLKKEELRKSIRQMSREIALWMLLHESEKAFIPEGVYREIEASFGGSLQEKQLHLIASFFHRLPITEGKNELCFIHRTMFEYFVADGFTALAVNAKTPEELSRVIGWYWHHNEMSVTVEQYVEEKLAQQKNELKFPLWEDAGVLLLEKGVHRCSLSLPVDTPNCLSPAQVKTLAEDREQENNTFLNLCILLNKVREITGYANKVYEDKKETPTVLESAIRHCIADRRTVFCPHFFLSAADLSGSRLLNAVLSGADLTSADLSGANLSSASLKKAELFTAILSRANLFDADLSDTDLSGAVMNGTAMFNANLSCAILTEKQVKELGFQMLFSCKFDKIYVGNGRVASTFYTRSKFFDEFFPNK